MIIAAYCSKKLHIFTLFSQARNIGKKCAYCHCKIEYNLNLISTYIQYTYNKYTYMLRIFISFGSANYLWDNLKFFSYNIISIFKS